MIVKLFNDKDLVVKLGNNSLFILNDVMIETRSHSYILRNNRFVKKQYLIRKKINLQPGQIKKIRFPSDHVISCKIIHGDQIIEKRKYLSWTSLSRSLI